MNGFTIKKSIHIHAKPEAVFDALTRSEDIVKYFPLKRVTSEWNEGSEILLTGENNGNEFRDYGVILNLSRPGRFRYSYWSDNHGTERTPENHLTIDYRLSPEPDGTRLDLEQNNLRSEEMATWMDAIWDALLDSLKAFVEQRT
ncbi:activator of Hsp90 ATPase 1 family protein [Methylocaldum marinum]|uniref:Activator of Hsp90 ATPase 1 family protein n=1 Tax=Methylocaldum marinum TaxID=1432792 RepID=A0A250KVR0_9GAMM|nr:SRPBCC domain-containing protein [Methylocaldum marinum]BBA33869.1 activator of Hsp90 ATPase 1 family protein [Methylocaldum marinum]